VKNRKAPKAPGQSQEDLNAIVPYEDPPQGSSFDGSNHGDEGSKPKSFSGKSVKMKYLTSRKPRFKIVSWLQY